MKKCSRCHRELDLASFYKKSGSADGLLSHCKICAKKERAAYYDKVKKDPTWREQNRKRARTWAANNPDHLKKTNQQYYLTHKEIIRHKQAEYYLENKETILASCKNWAKNNPEKSREIKARYREKNREKISQYQKQNRDKVNTYLREKKESDHNYALSCRLRSRLLAAIRRKAKTGSAVRDLGCSIPELLEMLDQDCLRKYGEPYSTAPKGKYHIDHIRPLAGFDLGDPEQLRRAVHHTNLQVLLAGENLQKGKK